jgi:hypothetical protein
MSTQQLIQPVQQNYSRSAATKFSHKSMGTLQRNKYSSDAARDSKELKRHAAWDMHRDGHKNQKTKLNL